jgi:hypothetical protein
MKTAEDAEDTEESESHLFPPWKRNTSGADAEARVSAIS